MNWKIFWNSVASQTDNVIAQVQRKKDENLSLTINHIVRNLQLTKSSQVLDVCCGNGMITKGVALHVKSIVGIDQSENLIAVAKNKFHTNNSCYSVGDALALSKVIQHQFDAIYVQFSFQYFDKKGQGEKLIAEMLRLLKPNGKIFIGDIPDYKKRFVFYNTLKKKFYLFTSKLKGTNPMGKFWKQQELDTICKHFNVKGIFLEQPKNLPNAWYRFDYLIEK